MSSSNPKQPLRTTWLTRFARGFSPSRWLRASEGLQRLSERFGVARVRVKGRGLMQGIECADGATADRISRAAFQRGLIIETSGNRGQVLKCLCPLTITSEELRDGLGRLAASLEQELGGRTAQAS